MFRTLRTSILAALFVVACAAVSVLHGNWQPMVFFALAGGMSSALFRWGCKTSK